MKTIVPDSRTYRQAILAGNTHEDAIAAHEYTEKLKAIFAQQDERLKKEGWINAVKI